MIYPYIILRFCLNVFILILCILYGFRNKICQSINQSINQSIINRDNLPLTLHELAQAPTKDSDVLDIETIGNLVESVL